MEEYYVFKLNLAPNVINMYVENRSGGWKQLQYHVITSDLKRVFGEPEEFKKSEVMCFSLNQPDIKEQILNSKEYEEFENNYERIEKEYFSVIDNHSKESGIFWSDEFLNVIKPNAINSLNKLLKSFPLLQAALEDISNNAVMGNLKGYSAYGHGRKNIIESRKILKYIQETDTIYTKSKFFYELSTERIYIPKEAVSKNEAIKIADEIEASINAKNRLTIGNVSINVIQKKVKIDKDYASITVYLAYPNGAQQVEDRDMASRKLVNAEKVKKTYEAPKGEKINSVELSNQLRKDATLGYLKGVYSKGKDILEKIPDIVEKFFE